jgi:NADP-dependent 3-hydroxy acid dehydrogenase YdfG
MTRLLDGTVALVTGASSGIGEAIAIALADEGAAVAIAARRTERLAALAATIHDAGCRVTVIPADVTDRTDALGLANAVVAELGRLDTLVNNAGVMLLGPAIGAPVEDGNRWSRSICRDCSGLPTAPCRTCWPQDRIRRAALRTW